MNKKTNEIEKLSFETYYESLPIEEKLILRDKLVPRYLGLPSFYSKLRANRWTELEREKIQELTGKTFES